MRYLLKFSYDGSNYNGFQTQKGLHTIQEELEKAVSKVNNKDTNVVATGRTDKGVHAYSQYAHVDIDVDINEYKLKRALNSNLPDDIHIISTKVVPDNFHARYDIKSKEYRYYINLGEYNPIDRNYVFQYNYQLNVEKMSEAIKYFVGKHDFRAFVTENKEKENCVRTITKASIMVDNNIVEIKFIGDGFLRYQVRNMVGYLIKVGEEKVLPESVIDVLESKDRTKSGKTAPPEGLYLYNVEYKEE
ncbi:MAG: tRNA pseudouridine(38-40) synthase TruA [Bacilli bacterium]|nr:tRNA pseudouridine(38-40) synthase TruA [Bacilli bacterium]